MIDLELMDALLDALPAARAARAGRRRAPAARDRCRPDPRRPRRADRRGARVARARAQLPHGHRRSARPRRVRGRARGPRRRRRTSSPSKHGLATARTPGTLTFSGASGSIPRRAGRSTTHARGRRRAVAPLRRAARAAHRERTRVPVRRRPRRSRASQRELDELWQLLGARADAHGHARRCPPARLALNAYLHDLALDRMTVTGRPDFVPGEPVMITANDYQRGLFNGDQGIVVRADEGARPPSLPRRVPRRRRAACRSRSRRCAIASSSRGRSPCTRARAASSTRSRSCSPHDELPLRHARAALHRRHARANVGRDRRHRRRSPPPASASRCATPASRHGCALCSAVTDAPPCPHTDRKEGVCVVCGHCVHEVILNGACFFCGTTDLDPVAMSPKKTGLIAPEQLVRKK